MAKEEANAILPFPVSEFESRLRKTREQMQEKGIDMLYITMPESMYYISGLNLNWYQMNSPGAWDSSAAMGIAIQAEHDDFILFTIPDEESTVVGATCAKDIRLISDFPNDVEMFGHVVKGVGAGRLPMDGIVDELQAEGWLKGVIAMEMGSPRPSWRVGRMLADKFIEAGVGVSIVDGTDVIKSLRSIKSPLEIACVKKASDYADIAHRSIVDGMYEGMTERELAGVYTKAMYDAGGESMGIVDQVGFGHEKFWWVHSQAGSRKLMREDPIRVDLCGVCNRYHANQARHYSFGKPEPYLVETVGYGVLVMNKVKEIIEPNMYVNDFWDKLKGYMVREGFWDKQYWTGGYELGIAFPPDWCGEFCYDASEDMGEIRFIPGTVCNFESGFGAIDTLVFEEDKATILGNTPWELQVIEPDVKG